MRFIKYISPQKKENVKHTPYTLRCIVFLNKNEKGWLKGDLEVVVATHPKKKHTKKEKEGKN